MIPLARRLNARGMITIQDFSSVMEQLGVYLSGQEMKHIERLFDR